MQIQEKIEVLEKLAKYMLSHEEEWKEVKLRANDMNYWFIPNNIDESVEAIAHSYLDRKKLEDFIASYKLSIDADIDTDQKLGIIMAGNIPLVGFHDFLMGFLAGYTLHLKLSSKDKLLLRHLIEKLQEWEPRLKDKIHIQDMLKDCSMYIATGSNNTAQTFAYYFSKYPNLIRHNRSSVAILNGKESEEDLKALTKDIFQYFGLGCRNVSKIFIPKAYDFAPLLEAINKYAVPKDHHQYLNNFDYQLALVMLNGVQYISADHMILVESTSNFAPTSMLHYQYYEDLSEVQGILQEDAEEIQTVVSNISELNYQALGNAQNPQLNDFADGEDSFAFLLDNHHSK